jgi:hypothetical protein
MRVHNIPQKIPTSVKPSILLEAMDLNTKLWKILNGGNLTTNIFTYLGSLKRIIKWGRTLNRGTLNGDFTI